MKEESRKRGMEEGDLEAGSDVQRVCSSKQNYGRQFRPRCLKGALAPRKGTDLRYIWCQPKQGNLLVPMLAETAKLAISHDLFATSLYFS